jgi:glycerol uptake facilitator-like aquaporin
VTAALWRRLVAEFAGTALLVTVVVGSGIAASRLSPSDVGLQLLENSTVTAFGLTVLILMFGPVSGAHFNPVVTLADWALSRRASGGLAAQDVLPYLAAQTLGAIGGAVLANGMFDVPTRWSTHDRSNGHLLLGEVVATAGPVGRTSLRPPSAPTSARPTGSPPRPASRTRR